MIDFEPSLLTAKELALQDEVRSFVADRFQVGEYLPDLGINAHASPEFSKELATRGWLGMAIPAKYGGHGCTAVERFVVIEALLAAGAPISAHWAGDRQIAAALLKFGSEEQKARFLPAIAAAETFFCLGMSEPDSGSDLASVRTTATPHSQGWELNGQKVWTSGAHYAHYAVTLCRTGPASEGRHTGLSQMIVDLRAPGVTVRPILMLNGFHHYNEVFFEGVHVPQDMVLGEIGSGWTQITSELAYERSGPDRFLSTFPLLQYLLSQRGVQEHSSHRTSQIGRLVAQFRVLRMLSLSVARALDAGGVPATEAALVKDLGTTFEQDLVDVVRELVDEELDPDGDFFAQLLADATITAPIVTLRGGTNEVLRGIIAKSLLAGRRAA